MISFEADRKEFLTALGVAVRAISAKSTMQILQCVLIEVGRDRVKLTGNDSEKSIQVSFPADVEMIGSTVVDAKIIHEIVRKLTSNTIEFTCDGNGAVTLKSGRAKFTIQAQDADQYPKIAEAQFVETISIEQAILRDMIMSTIFSVDASGKNGKVMEGELFEVDGDSLKVVAIDGHRVAMRTEYVNCEAEKRRVIVPGSTLQEIARILPDDMNDMVDISFAKNHIKFEMGDIVAMSRLIDGEYFDISSVINQNSTTSIMLNNEEFRQMLERSLLFVKEDAKTPVVVEIHGDSLNLSIKSQTGSFSEDIDIIESSGRDELVIGFNARFLLEVLKAIADEEVALCLSNAKSPCVIRNNANGYLYVILPVNLGR